MINSDAQNDCLTAYDEIAEHYQDYSQNRSAYLRAVEKMIIDRFPKNPRWLDIGIGDGKRAVTILQQIECKEFVAVEPSSNMAKVCRSNGIPTVYETTIEELDQLDIGQFDVVTAMWNVLGHIQGSENRIKAVQNIQGKLNPTGIFMFDVNNRHNANSYGFFKVLGRRIIDSLAFDETRGDAYYDWEVNNKKIPSFGHLFIPSEVKNLISQSDMKIKECVSVDYQTGQVSKSLTQGQLFYSLQNV